jgi:hypothetical protein
MTATTQNNFTCRAGEKECTPMVAQAHAPAWMELSFGAAIGLISIMGIIDVIFVVLFLAAMVSQ